MNYFFYILIITLIFIIYIQYSVGSILFRQKSLGNYVINLPSLLITPSLTMEEKEVTNPRALGLVELLHTQFNSRRLELLELRNLRQAELDDGKKPDFLKATQAIREDDWVVAPIPHDLQNRRVEITGPVDRKMVINALNAPVKTFMADFEDSCSPTWGNIIHGQINLRDAVNGDI